MSERYFDLGIASMDRLIGGGIPSGSVVSLLGGPGSGRMALSLRFISHGLEKGENGLFISFTSVSLASHLGGNRRSFRGIMRSEDPIFLNTTDMDGIEVLLDLIDEGEVERMVLDRPEVLGMRGIDNWFTGFEDVLNRGRSMKIGAMVTGGKEFSAYADMTSDGIFDISRHGDGRLEFQTIRWPYSDGGMVVESEAGEWMP